VWCSKKIEDEDGFVISCGECNDNGLMPWTQEDEEKYASMAAGEMGSPTSSVGSPTLESEFL
jgi:dissimilatory sulfite reductase (desulfoviridin) alpha/beta subunit